MSSPHLSLHKTMGALFIGVMVANTLHGISIVQAFYYYRHQTDTKPLKLLVGAVMVVDTIHQALITQTVYTSLVSYWGNVEALGNIVPSLIIQNFFNALTALFVQSFLTARVWKLSDGNVLLTGLLAVFVVAEFVCVFVFSFIGVQFKTYPQLLVLRPLSLAVNVLAAVGDVLIAGSLCYLLHRFRTGFQRSDTLINKLMMFALNTGLITSLCAIGSFVSYMIAQNTLIYITFYFCIGRLYTNSLLATLNARKTLGRTYNVPLSSFKVPKTVASSGQQHDMANVPAKIDAATAEYMQDRKMDDDGGKLIEHSQTSSSSVAVGFEDRSIGV